MFLFIVIISKGSSNSSSLFLIFAISLFLRERAETSASRIDLFRWFLDLLNGWNQILISDCVFVRRPFSICLPYQSLFISLLWAATLLLFRETTDPWLTWVLFFAITEIILLIILVSVILIIIFAFIFFLLMLYPSSGRSLPDLVWIIWMQWEHINRSRFG